MKRILSVAVVLCGILAIYVFGRSEPPPPAEAAPPDTGGDFTLTGTEGQRVSLADFRGKVVLMFFGFTNCPDACPTTMITLRSVREKLAGRVGDIQVIFITVDPERDTPEVMKEYVAHFGSFVTGLTGTAQEISEVAEQYNTLFRIVKTEGEADYSVGHTDFIYLIDKEGQTRALYSSKTPVVKLVKDIPNILEAG